eukprot:scaffold98235_cov69-Phaeocystis_antarctica.AAC.2
MQCARSAHAVRTQCARSAHAVHMQCTCGAHAVHMQCTCGAHAVHMQCTCGQAHFGDEEVMAILTVACLGDEEAGAASVPAAGVPQAVAMCATERSLE